MKQQKSTSKPVKIAVRVFGYLILFICVGILSYKGTVEYYKATGEYSGVKRNAKNSNNIVTPSVDPVAVNAIFGVDQETAKIKQIIVEVFNTKTRNIDLLTIPASTKYSMSKKLFDTITKKNGNVPQIVKFSELSSYFNQDQVYEYGTLILKEYLGTDISFYTAMVEENFSKYFVKDKKKKVYTFSKEAMSKLRSFTEENQVKDELKDYYQKIQSNLRLADRKSYAEYYVNAKYGYVHLWKIAPDDGENELSAKTKQQVEKIVNNRDTYQSEQKKDEDKASAESLNAQIEILNASNVSGLASSYQKKLMNDGYHVGKIGNYSQQNRKVTKIIVKKKGLEAGVESYFKNPEIETGVLDGAYDIVIILGTDDA